MRSDLKIAPLHGCAKLESELYCKMTPSSFFWLETVCACVVSIATHKAKLVVADSTESELSSENFLSRNLIPKKYSAARILFLDEVST